MQVRLLKLLLLSIMCVALFAITIRLTRPRVAPTATASHINVDRAGPTWAYPDPNRTPGIANPQITDANKLETICNPSWSTRSIRPPSPYISRLKREQMWELRLPGSASDYEEDHFIPLELGGDPTNPRNLWPEPYDMEPGAKEKDAVENYLHRQVCSGAMTLEEARHLIVTDWYRVYLERLH